MRTELAAMEPEEQQAVAAAATALRKARLADQQHQSRVLQNYARSRTSGLGLPLADPGDDGMHQRDEMIRNVSTVTATTLGGPGGRS